MSKNGHDVQNLILRSGIRQVDSWSSPVKLEL
eukprot:COSAG02_NODE_13932_length_1329_cov_2.563415_1_plen_31_part_10